MSTPVLLSLSESLTKTYGRIRVWLTVIVLAMIAVPALLAGWSSYRTSRDLIRSGLEAELLAVLRYNVRWVDHWLDARRSDLDMLGRSEAVRDILDGRTDGLTRERLLRHVSLHHRVQLGEITVFDSAGICQWPAGKSTPIRRALLEQARAGTNWIAIERAGTAADETMVGYAAVMDDRGRLRGVLRQDFAYREFAGWVSEALAIDQTDVDFVGPAGRSLLTAPGRAQRVGADPADFPDEMQVESYQLTDGRSVLRARSVVGHLGIAVVAERDESVSSGALALLRRRLALIAAAALGVALVFALLLSRFTVSRLERRDVRLLDRSEQLIISDKLSVVGQMAASVAHEVNNPLTTIKILAHDLQERMPPTDDRREDFAVLLGEIDKIRIMVLRFLQFARPSPPELTETDFNDLLRRVIDLVSLQVERKAISLTSNLDRELPPISIDMSQAGQVFLNILLNAIEAAPEDGTVKVSTRHDVASAIVIVGFWNSGPSITEDVRERAFDPFFSTSPSGTGLGLPICRMIMERLHGTIEIAPTPPDGTRVRLTFPVTPTEDRAEKTRTDDAAMPGR